MVYLVMIPTLMRRKVRDVLGPIAEALQSNDRLTHLATCTYRRMQITVEPKPHASETIYGTLSNSSSTHGIFLV